MTRREKQLYNALNSTTRLLYALRFQGLVVENSTVKRIVANYEILRHHCPTCGIVD